MAAFYKCVAVCVLLAKTAPAINVNVECKCEQLSRLFSMNLFINTTQLMFLSNDMVDVQVNSGIVSSPFGNITDEVGILKASLNIKCSDVQHIRCKSFGMVYNPTSYSNLTITPQLEFNVATSNLSITQTPVKETYGVGDVVLFTCSALFGVNRTRLQWVISHSDITGFQPVPGDSPQASTVTLSECSYHAVSKYVHVLTEHGDITLKCIAENDRSRSTSLTIRTGRDNHSTHLFLSSMLVYVHFIMLPCVFALFGDKVTFRKPERLCMRRFRTAMSFLVGLTFFIWWIIILRDHLLRSLGYFMYAVIEFVFVLGYTLTRFIANLSRRFEKKRQRYLYNIRVATSYGATMTPSICWIMIRCYGGTSIIGLEAFFWLVTIGCFTGFVCVSKSREGKYWEVPEKCY
ncbi:uncharacterized protein LOC124127251 [Haliotis rufescens]|uniref:uncharacterized protein LOC124127251 n=1 Tax=Haliotis rufescens TaxID=6454 RepID=UPI001EAFA64D|nr:uncharacterized protein LOC124127251 [Haliotis rufescens]XP_046346635.1 uncharacterized protein LOC124127251 [Haliotis rufescens]